MEVLMTYLSPQAKKQRLAVEETLDERMDDEEDHDDDEESCGQQPVWARQMQQTILKEMTTMLRPITDGMEEFRTELSNIKLQVGLVQAEAEEATTHAGFAHAAAEEAANLAHALDEKVEKIQASTATVTQVKHMIEEALSKQCNERNQNTGKEHPSWTRTRTINAEENGAVQANSGGWRIRARFDEV